MRSILFYLVLKLYRKKEISRYRPWIGFIFKNL